MSLGIIDWGIGGVSIYKQIRERGRYAPVIYFSDTGVTPYGKMSRTELVSRLDHVIEFFAAKGVTHLVIGCNAASTAIAFLKPTSVTVEGVIGPAVATTLRSRPARLGLIGGRRTVLSGIYRRRFAEHGLDIRQRIAQPLSALIESGDVDSARLHAECRRILAPLRTCSHILLACTHYPAIEPVLREYVPRTVRFIDPASALVDKIWRWNIKSNGEDIFLTSGNAAAMKRAASTAFGCELRSVERVTI